mgnify:CR=1 FL=1
MKHSKGMWRFFPNGGSEEFKRASAEQRGNIIISNMEGQRPIAHVNVWMAQTYPEWNLLSEEALANARLIAEACSVPHECDPGCPGEQNRRKLAAYGELLAECRRLEPDYNDDYGFKKWQCCGASVHADYSTVPNPPHEAHCTLKAALARAEEAMQP